MKIYDFEGFPNPARVRIALKEKGLFDDVEFVSINVPGGEHKKPEFLAKNPSAAVPVLELYDGTCISECSAITEYLDHLDGAPVLTGTSPEKRGRIAMMQRRAEAGLLDAVGAYFHHATDGLGPDIEGYQNAEWGNQQKKRAVATMGYLDDVLAGQDYLAGDEFSVADITAFAGLSFADFVGIETPQAHKNLASWRFRMEARPSIGG
ncbi:glutathione S-transferase [Sphingorhabdus sp. Alg239-R122]|uniref:glutathione S-transferase family protein n=1 Tax=Sphingorhabdus sp. Alg239-R122 TaxID=2305989 RepID=UPI0013DABF29|nr:glutathione S-transferase [Sphingorhabdus sp. Alg239-R122]